MKTSLLEFEVNNYRSCLRSAFRLRPDLTVLIGINGSGKTNILNAIQVLGSVAGDRSYREAAKATSTMAATLSVENTPIYLRANVGYISRPQGAEEVVTECKLNLKNLTGKDEWFEFPPSWTRELHFFQQIKSKHPSEKVLRHHFFPGAKSRLVEVLNSDHYTALIEAAMDFLRNIKYYSASLFTDPSLCPPSIELEDGRLSYETRPSRHRKLLLDMYSAFSARDKDTRYDEFISIVGKNGLRLIDRLDFKVLSLPHSKVEVAVGGRLKKQRLFRKLIIPIVKIDGTQLSPSQLSEGTFKTIAIIFYLIMNRGSLLLIEEPELCIHHGLLNSIVELIKNFSEKGQILISTHSDFVLDSLDPENIFLVDKRKKTGTTVSSISETMAASEFKALRSYLAKSGNLGEYWIHGGFDRND